MRSFNNYTYTIVKICTMLKCIIDVLIKFYPKFYPKSFRLYRHFYTQKQKKVKLKANRLNGLQSTTFMEIFLWFNQCPGNSEIPG